MMINFDDRPLEITIKNPRPRTRRGAVLIVVASWLLIIFASLCFVHWATDRPPESDAIMDLSTEEGAVIEMWESTVGGPSLTSFFTFTGVAGDRYECRRLP